MKDIGFIGLGAMGAHMARHLLDHGFRVHAFDVDDAALARAVERGAVGCARAADVGDAAGIVLVCLPTPDIVRRVVTGPEGVIEGGRVRIFVDHSTTGPSVAREIGERLAARGIAALDAPLAGGVAGAEAGTLSVMVSGPAAAYEEARGPFAAFGRKIVHVGTAAGQGQTLKLINNMIVGATLVAASEAILFGVRAGLPPDVMLDVINESTGRSFTTQTILANAVLSRRFDFGFRLELMRKDMRLCVAEADALGVTMPTCTVVKQIFDIAYAGGAGPQDMTRVVEVLERWANATIALPPPADGADSAT